MRATSTREIIEKLKEYEEKKGVGIVVGITTFLDEWYRLAYQIGIAKDSFSATHGESWKYENLSLIDIRSIDDEIISKNLDLPFSLNSKKIYIIERGKPEYSPDPEILNDGKKALYIVKGEYNENMKKLGTSQGKLDKFDCYWNFENDKYCGNAVIYTSNEERWEWRITEHNI